MPESRYYDISILLVDKVGNKRYDSIILPGESKFAARQKAEEYLKVNYLDPQWKIKRVFTIKESAYTG